MNMQNNAVLRRQIDAVKFKDMEELREQFQALYGFDCGDTTARHLRKRIIYRLQELCLGGVDSIDMSILEDIADKDPLANLKVVAAKRSAKVSGTKLEFEITDGEYAGRKLWARLNIENQNAEAVRMARADLSAICRAVNVLTPNDSADLHNLPLVIKVHCRKDKNTGEITNDIRGYEPKANYRPEPKQAPAAPVSSQGVRVPSKPPWM